MFDSQLRLGLICGALSMLSACFSPTLPTSQPQTVNAKPAASTTAPPARTSSTASAGAKASTPVNTSPPLSAEVDAPQPTPTPAASASAPLVSAASFSGGSGGNATPVPTATLPPNGKPYLDDVIWIGQGSIKPDVQTQPIGIKARYTGKSITLRLTGYFYAPQAESVFLTLDHQIPLNPIFVSNTRIDAQFDTALIPDLYLVGSQHLLSIQVGDEILQTNLRVAEPDTPQLLSPQIQSVTVMRDEEGHPQQLKVTGQHFMRNPNFAQCNIDQTEAPILESTHDGTQAVLTVLIADSDAFAAQGQHQISYHTPFGLAIHYFNHEEGTP